MARHCCGSNNMHLILRILILCITALLLLPPPAIAKPPDEYELKAVILYKFLPFIEWPEDNSLSKSKTLNICVLGQDPFGKKARILERQSSSRQKIKIFDDIAFSEISNCHILYISKSREKDLKGVLRKVSKIPVLTVSDIKGFVSHGGTIGLFINRQNKLKFEINLKSANAARMKIDAQMLEVAEKVYR